jgi:carboxyl-terminal processing protease
VANEGQLADLLAAAWPQAEVKGPQTTPDPDTAEDVMLRGMFRRLFRPAPGPGTGDAYLSAKERKGHEVLTGNRYVGTGVQIGYDAKEKLAQIINPFPGGPCRKAGGKPGDLIVSIDGVDMKGKPLGQFVKRLQGEDGTAVTAVVRQPGEKQTRTLNMVRGVIPFASVLGWQRKGEDGWSFRLGTDSDVGYLRFADFKASTAHELRRLEPAVRAEGVRALVIDLRQAAGSEMSHAVGAADALLDGGMMWKVRDRAGRAKEYKADRDCLFRDWPLAVLVGPHTGPLGEALAAALQDNHRAVVVGEPTPGRTGVTTLLPEPDGPGAVLIRTSVRERARPAKAAEDAEDDLDPASVRPDRVVRGDDKLTRGLQAWYVQQEVPVPNPAVKPPDDPQLARAVELLREALAKRRAEARPRSPSGNG